MDNWKRDAAGNIAAMPCAGYQIGAISPLVAVRLEYYENEDAQKAGKPSVLQLQMSPMHAASLSKSLAQTVVRLNERPEETAQ